MSSPNLLSTVAVGRRAEALAADHLVANGLRILDRNWRTRWCELDIVACSSSVVHVVEVKYRRSDRQGSGLDCITPQKALRLQRAALAWLQVHGLLHRPYQLDVVAVSGYPEPKYVNYLPNAIQIG